MNSTRIIIMFILIAGLFSSCTDRVPKADNSGNPLPECKSKYNCVRGAWQFPGDVAHTQNTAAVVIRNLGAEIISQKTDTIHAVFTIPYFKWKDDVHIQISANEKGSILFIRSKSRVGNWDIFANRLRVLRITRKMSYKV